MADVFIAAAAEENARARGLADALTTLGFKVGADVPQEAELTKLVEEAKCVVAVWPNTASPPPWLAAVATLALERKKLVSLELAKEAAPTLFRAAPRTEIFGRDRTLFKQRFETLVTEIDKLAKREGEQPADKLPEALIKARAALSPPPQQRKRRWTLGIVAGVVAAVFVVGFGAGRLINAVRSGELTFARPAAGAAAPPAAPAAQSAPAPFGITLEQLETLPWRDAAAKIDEASGERIRDAAGRDDAFAQTLACLGHLAGAPGFLPSPAAARQFCDQAADKNFPGALYLSYVVRRASPLAGISEAVARTRLQTAAAQKWLPAQLDYAQLLSSDFRGSLADQTEAGRIWLEVAEEGDARGQYNYARWLRDSPAGPRDPTSAIPFLQRAADAGLAEAQHMLATLYRDGIGVTRDSARARSLYERAATQNYPPSMFNLAAMIDAGPVSDQARAAELYRALSCMRDERQIQPMAAARLRAMRQLPAACD